MRHTKIVATLGPASSDQDTIAAMLRAGVDVFRLNFSHGSHETHAAAIETVRRVAARARRHVAILQDLGGLKIRTGDHVDGKPLLLKAGDDLEIRVGSELGRPGVISTTYAPLARAVSPGDRLLLDDGKVVLQVVETSPAAIRTRVVDGGALGERKGINAPGVPLPPAGITEKDEADLRFGLEAGVDLVGLSFVQTPDDLSRARELTVQAGRPHVPLVAKLERPEAIDRLNEICAVADALMVARGDLGLEMPLEQVPQVQKQVLRVARARGVPVIIATQVLESMRTESRPTRAEVSDAAGAVDAGADAIMLSGETAIGAYPVGVVEVLDAIIRSAESVPPVWSLPAPSVERPDHLPSLCDAAVTLAVRANADAVIARTTKGRTARLLAARRPSVPIFAVTGDDTTARPLSLWWGVEPVVGNLADDIEVLASKVVRALQDEGRLPSPATVVLVSGRPELHHVNANFVWIRRL